VLGEGGLEDGLDPRLDGEVGLGDDVAAALDAGEPRMAEALQRDLAGLPDAAPGDDKGAGAVPRAGKARSLPLKFLRFAQDDTLLPTADS